jgi:hypothetical protein
MAAVDKMRSRVSGGTANSPVGWTKDLGHTAED